MLRLSALVIALVMASSAAAESVPVPLIASDVWLRSGPSTSHSRITGLPRGTAIVEIASPDTAFKRRSARWIRIFVLEGRSAGLEGWVWGQFVSCCESYEWLE